MTWSSSVRLMGEPHAIAVLAEAVPMVAFEDACYSGAVGGRAICSDDPARASAR